MRLPLFTLLLFLLLPLNLYAATAAEPQQAEPPVEISPDRSPIIDLGEVSWRGVAARAQLEPRPDLDDGAPLTGELQHFLLRVRFVDPVGGEMIEGEVAVRNFAAKEQALTTVRLQPQETDWSGVLALPTRGESLLKIGSKLGDGKKRIYRFFYQPPSTLAAQ